MIPEHRFYPQELSLVEKPLEHLNRLSTQDRIIWAYRIFDPGYITLTTSGGETSAILPHVISTIHQTLRFNTPLRLIFVDTLLYGRSTYDFIEKLKKKGIHDGFEVLVYKPRVTLQELTEHYPDWSNYNSLDFQQAKYYLKQEPLDRAFQELQTKLWINGIMRDELDSRKDVPVFKQRTQDDLYVLHPICDWSRPTALEYIRQQNLPTNPNHYDFFKGENQKLECGIHI